VLCLIMFYMLEHIPVSAVHYECVYHYECLCVHCVCLCTLCVCLCIQTASLAISVICKICLAIHTHVFMYCTKNSEIMRNIETPV